MITQTRGSAVLQTQKTFLVKERVGVLKLTDTFDIFDPQTGAQIALATEQISTVAKLARIFINNRFSRRRWLSAIRTAWAMYGCHCDAACRCCGRTSS
jgi:hypothetical protein